ncbi:winged helix-turn-helix domain-containing protein [Niameybacter sp.]
MEEKIQSGALMIDKVNRSVSYGQDLIQLTPKEFDILCLLASNKGKIYSKEQIYSNVWKEAYTYDDSNIMAHIRKLRKKIEPDPTHPIFILTIWGVGYKFINPVHLP